MCLSMQRAFVDGRYLVERLLGSGGMAQVYLTHDEVLDRHVALKILRDQYAEDEEFIQRFRREARSAASLSHPNIVSIYDQGRSEDGAYYIAFEYVPGGTLKERIRREGVLESAVAVRVALQITNALSEAHEKGVIHRDIKPQNLLVTQKGDVKVTDFGIARAAASISSVATGTGAVLGTAAYMSPEQARGDPVGPQSDLYSLGVVLYEMLTGTLPYEAESPIALAMMHINEPPRSPRQVNPEVPEPLNALTLKLLAKDPEDRYPSAPALANDLDRVRSGLPLAAVDTNKTGQMPAPLPPLSAAPEGRTAKTTLRRSVTAPVGRPGGRGARVRSGLRYALVALLFAFVLLGPLAFALGLFEGLDATGSGGDEAQSDTEEEGANLVQVPDLYWPATAQTDLAAVGLELGRQDETPNDMVPVGVVSEQDPVQGSEVEEGTAVDIVVSTGPRQAPVNDEKERERQRQEEEKQREKQQQEQEKQKEKKQQEEEKRKERGE
jgi:tRNA A-37 threonylcarbamoyl transferase component Bud32